MAALSFFNHPVVAALLLALAFLGLLVEVRSPGLRRAGWAGLLALALFLVSHLAAEASPWTVLPVLGGVAVLWPALADPARRAHAAAGVLLVAAGAWAVLVGPGPDGVDHARAATVLLAAALLVILAATLLWWRLPAAERPARRGRVFFFLPRPPAGTAEPVAPAPGDRGRAASPLRPGGRVVVGGERVDAVAEDEWIEEGDEVELVEWRGIHARVRRVPSADGGGVDVAPPPG